MMTLSKNQSLNFKSSAVDLERWILGKLLLHSEIAISPGSIQ